MTPEPRKLLPDTLLLDLPTTFLSITDEALTRFSVGYHEYGPGAADDLGLAGQWGDLHRKVNKLRRALWEGDEGYLSREGVDDILYDILGHTLLALDMRRRGMPLGKNSTKGTN